MTIAIIIFFSLTFPIDLTLTITETDLVVKEGEDIDITCSPSSPNVALEWGIPVAASSEGTVVSYNEPLRQTLTIRNANLNHEGTYTCRVVGDREGVVSAASASVKVRESKLERFSSQCSLYGQLFLFCLLCFNRVSGGFCGWTVLECFI